MQSSHSAGKDGERGWLPGDGSRKVCHAPGFKQSLRKLGSGVLCPWEAVISNEKQCGLTAGGMQPATRRAHMAGQGKWPSRDGGGGCEKFCGPKGAQVMPSEDSRRPLWPGQTAPQLKEGRSLLLPAHLEHPQSVQPLEQSRLFPKH